MASLLELSVGTGKWDAGLKKAQSALNNFTQSQGGLQQALGKDNEKIVQFVQMMGKMESTANTAKGQLRDYRNSIEQLSSAFNSLSEAQKKGVEGQTITSALDSLKAKALAAKQEVERLNVELGETSSKASGLGSLNQVLGGVAGKFGLSPAMFTGVGAAIAGIGTAAKIAGDNIRTAFNFEKSMSYLSALTGKTGKDLETLKEYAIELGSTTTLTASQVADAFRLIGSQQPQLLESSEALRDVTKAAIRLSEASGMELATASQTLSTSINQMGGDSSNAAKYVNVLAAASQKGAGDIAWLGEAITKSGTYAKAVGASYESLVANLETLAKAGYDASTAGTALRSIILALEKQADDNLKPSVVGLTEAFENLGKQHLSIGEYANLVNQRFAAQAMTLAENAAQSKAMTEAITGTNIAEEQADTNTTNLAGSLKALSSAWEGLNLHINSSNGLLKDFIDWAKEAVKWADRGLTSSGRQAGFRNDIQNNQSTRMFGKNITGVVPNLQRLGGSNYKGQVYHEIQQMYNDAIYAGINYIDKHTQPGSKSREEAQASLDAIKAAQQEFTDRAKKMLGLVKEKAGNKGKVDLHLEVDAETEGATKSVKQLQDELKKLKKLRDEAAGKGDTKLRDKYNIQIKGVQDQIKVLRGNTDPKGKSPQQQAQAKFEQAEKDYNQALEQAALEVKAGTADTVAAKKKELSATETLWKSIGDAREIYDSNELKTAQEDAAKKVVELGGSVNALVEEQKNAQEAARELANAQKKAAEAYRKMQDAQANNDLKAYNTALKQYQTSQADVIRLGGELPKLEDRKVIYTVEVNDEQLAKLKALPTNDETIKINVEEGEVNLPLVPKDDQTIRFNVEQGKVDLPEVPKTYTVTIEAATQEAAATVDNFVQDMDAKKVEIPVNVEQPKPVEVPVTMSYTDNNMSAFLSSLKERIAQEDVGSTLYKNLTAQLADANALANLMQTAIKNGIDVTQFNPQDLWSKVFGKNPGDYITDAQWQTIQDTINAKLKEMKLDPIKLNFETGGLTKDAKINENAWKDAASAVQQLGSALNGLEDPAAKVAGTIAQAIATISLSYAKALEMAATTSGPWGWIAFAATGMATMINTISTVKNASHYAQGGIVPGNDFTDSTPVYVSSGELILNKAQQNTLAAELTDRGNDGGGSSTPYVSGEQIFLGLNNYLKRSGRGELITARG